MPPRRTPTERFRQKIGSTEGCWIWQGSVFQSTGRPRFRLDGKEMPAARAAWFLFRGDPGDMFVCHNCPGGDNKLCVNPEHLYLGTPAQNSADMVRKGRQTKGERNGRARLTEEDVRAIRQRLSAGEMQKTLAQEYKVAHGTVYWIANGQHWKEVK